MVDPPRSTWPQDAAPAAISRAPADAPARNCPDPVHPDPATGTYLDARKPPELVNEYLSRIGSQERDIEKGCR